MENGKEIRPLAGCEIEEALALVWDVFAEYEAADCDQEGVDEFWSRIDYEYLLQRAGDGDVRFLGAFDEGMIVGVLMMRQPDHVELLYVDGEYQRQGVGTALLKKAAMDAKEADRLLHRVTANVPPNAAGFFRKLGFAPMGEAFRSGGLRYQPMAVEGIVEKL